MSWSDLLVAVGVSGGLAAACALFVCAMAVRALFSIRWGKQNALARDTARRCTATESGGVRCERPYGHAGGCACPEALRRAQEWYQ